MSNELAKMIEMLEKAKPDLKRRQELRDIHWRAEARKREIRERIARMTGRPVVWPDFSGSQWKS